MNSALRLLQTSSSTSAEPSFSLLSAMTIEAPSLENRAATARPNPTKPQRERPELDGALEFIDEILEGERHSSACTGNGPPIGIKETADNLHQARRPLFSFRGRGVSRLRSLRIDWSAISSTEYRKRRLAAEFPIVRWNPIGVALLAFSRNPERSAKWTYCSRRNQNDRTPSFCLHDSDEVPPSCRY